MQRFVFIIVQWMLVTWSTFLLPQKIDLVVHYNCFIKTCHKTWRTGGHARQIDINTFIVFCLLGQKHQNPFTSNHLKIVYTTDIVRKYKLWGVVGCSVMRVTMDCKMNVVSCFGIENDINIAFIEHPLVKVWATRLPNL